MDNEESIPDLTLQDSIRLLIQQVPIPVRDFILNELDTKTEELMARHGLHLDQGGILENELLLMLLGQETPAEFVTALQGTGISSDTVWSLTKDINQEIFMKLRSAEQTRGTAAANPVSVPAVTPAPIIVQTPPPAPAYKAPDAPAIMPSAPLPPIVPLAPTRSSVSEFARPVPTPTFPVHTASIPAPSAETQLRPDPFSPVMPDVHVPARTMAHDMQEMRSGANPIQVAQPPIATPSPIQQVPNPLPLQPLPQPTPQTTNRDALHAVLKEYGVDPYREPPV